MMRWWVDGVEGAGVPGDDPGLTLGLTAFETMRIYNGRPFRLGAHIERLLASAAMMGLPCPGACAVEVEILDALDISAIKEASLRYTLTAGGRRVLAVQPADASRVGRPVRLASHAATPSVALPAWVKHGSRAAWELEARHRRVDELLLVDPDGFMLETSRGNVLAVFKERLVAPPDDGRRLSGITLQAALQAAQRAGLPVETREVRRDDPAWDGLLVCSTLKEIAPVTELDTRPLPSSPLAAHLLAALQDLIAAECGAPAPPGSAPPPPQRGA